MKKWICTVCRYTHEGDNPPESCPICKAAADKFNPLADNAAGESAAPPQKPVTAASSPIQDNRFIAFVNRHFPLYQFHPIMAHFPNGLIPVSVFFLLLAILFDFRCVELTAFYTLCAATLVSPLTVATGIYNWKTRYKGAVTSKFMFKLYGGITFTILGLVAIGWRLLNPQVVETTAGLYFIINLALLGLVGALGHIGGTLVFAGRKK